MSLRTVLWLRGMNETFVVSMLPVLLNTLCCEVAGVRTFTMPRVVPDQREKFENDELFRKLNRESEVRIICVYFPGFIYPELRSLVSVCVCQNAPCQVAKGILMLDGYST